MMFLEGSHGTEGPSATLESISSVGDVTYSCGSCGYLLNLSSSCRNTANIGSKYRKAIKKGLVSFYYIDESRFTHTDELSCLPYFNSKLSWGIFRRRTKLGCRRCGNYIGCAYEEYSPLPSFGSDCSHSSSGNGAGSSKKYEIKISALQPSSEELALLLDPPPFPQSNHPSLFFEGDYKRCDKIKGEEGPAN
ncbi:Uncharacterized protein AXF42_Ash017773 [Apostasia shenzhenica]|uniref:Uncharacterized protein n=1 Tax=Apostasia shenzhenica TaxID=1088818 RepID=A0A2I0B674_9ASPA|nr:Uncharacterized protein AXF42_Ash017773 [Apostasia shenzhenica]